MFTLNGPDSAHLTTRSWLAEHGVEIAGSPSEKNPGAGGRTMLNTGKPLPRGHQPVGPITQ
jgi:hypothetical protein